MPLRDARVLVTGASGFIGSHVARACVREGAAVACLLRPTSDTWRLAEALPVVKRYDAALEDEAAVTQAFEDFKPTIVLNLAADTNRKRDLGLYEIQHATHVRSTLSLIRAALKSTSPIRFVHTGTIEEYGRGDGPYRESQREEPITPYSLTKHESVRLVQYAATEHGLDAVVLRPSLTYGPFQGKKMFVPQFIHAAMTDKAFNMSPGEQTRDFLYMDDAVAGFLAAATAEDVKGRVLNLATGVETRMRDVAEQLRSLFNNDVTINAGFYPCDPKVETMRCFMDISLIRERLGWQPSTTLADGLKKTVEWYQTSANHYPHLWD